MATVQATAATVPTQARTVRTAATWSPTSGPMHNRPWRSSPLAGPVFSRLPPIILESSEESHENGFDALDGPRELGQTQRSPSSSSIVSDSLAASTSGYGSRNASGSASALILVEGEASTSSISLHASSSAHGNGTSSHGHGNSQTHSHRPARLTKSPGRRPSSAQGKLQASKNVSEVSIIPPPRARTVSHGRSRSASFPSQTVTPSPTIPQTYSQASPSPASPGIENNTSKQPSTSRDPAANWMSSSPFGPAMTPKFSRLAMASPTVVMPLSAREYRKRNARKSLGKGKETELPTSSNHVTFTDNTPSAIQTPNGVPLVRVSPPPSEDVHQPRSLPPSSGDDSFDRRIQPQPQAEHPPKPLPHASLSTQSQSHPSPSMPQHKRPRSRPNTPPRSSPLASHPPISPKSSAATFYSLASASSLDDDRTPTPPHGTDDSNATNGIPPARPRPRPRRRKSYPDRLSNGARLSLLEAMNRLSQESTSLQRLPSIPQIDGANRLSIASQASGHTLFYDIESDGEGRLVCGDQDRDGDGNGDGDGGSQKPTSVLHTQSLEDLSSTLARTGIEVVHPEGDGDLGAPLDDERKGKRNVRMVRISDTVEVSSAPEPRRRKLTKSRPGPARGSTPGPAPGTGTGLGTVKGTKVQTQTQIHERRGSLLPWKSKGSSSESKAGAVGARSGAVSPSVGEKHGEDSPLSTPIKGHVHPNETTTPTPVLHSPASIANGSTHVESPTKPKSNDHTKKPSSDSPTPTSTPSTTPRKAHRYTFSFLSSPTFHRFKREKSNTAPAELDLGPDQHANTISKPNESNVKGVESGTDSTSTSIRTITQGSQVTLTPTSPALYDLTTPASSGRGTSSSTVPMLRRLNAQAMAMAGVSEQNEWDGGGDSTPSLVTNGSTATSSSVPCAPSFVRLLSGEPFVPQPSGLKESFASEEDELEGVHGGAKERTPRVCMYRTQDQRLSARAETSEEDERVRLCARSSSGLSVNMGLSPSPRPGTPSSTLTTATETSGSYVSFSTLPASTATSSPSTSPSLLMCDKRDRAVSVSLGGARGGGDGDDCTCALCGQFVPRSVSPSPSPTRESDQAEMHPMFTVPLVTVPAPAVYVRGTYPRGRDAGMGSDARYVGRRKSARHLSVPVAPARSNQGNNHMHAHAHAPAHGGSVPTRTGVAPMTTRTKPEKKKTTMSPSPLPSPPKVKTRRRPQTAPAGTGDIVSKFIEDAKAMRAREGSADDHVGVGIDAAVGGDRRPTKHKGGSGSGQSKFKMVLKGLLKWNS